MLVLSRHRDESIMIGDDVVITIVDIRGDKVRLGIEAPHDIPVHRQEVYEAIKRENERATRVDSAATKDLGKYPKCGVWQRPPNPEMLRFEKGRTQRA